MPARRSRRPWSPSRTRRRRPRSRTSWSSDARTTPRRTGESLERGPPSPFRILEGTPRRLMVEWVFLCGVPIQSTLVLELATLVRDPALADKLERGVTRDLIVIGLTDDERTLVLRALAD